MVLKMGEVPIQETCGNQYFIVINMGSEYHWYLMMNSANHLPTTKFKVFIVPRLRDPTVDIIGMENMWKEEEGGKRISSKKQQNCDTSLAIK
jgi:hypothetical protein